MNVRRVFRGPSGRTWSAQIMHFPATGRGLEGHPPAHNGGAVLRFAADDLVLDLERWPADWIEWTDEQLVELARSANPPRLGLSPARFDPREHGGQLQAR